MLSVCIWQFLGKLNSVLGKGELSKFSSRSSSVRFVSTISIEKKKSPRKVSPPPLQSSSSSIMSIMYIIIIIIAASATLASGNLGIEVENGGLDYICVVRSEYAPCRYYIPEWYVFVNRMQLCMYVCSILFLNVASLLSRTHRNKKKRLISYLFLCLLVCCVL